MNSIVISGITKEVNQTQLYQLVELIGTIESVVYSENNAEMQVNYQSEESVEKALVVLKDVQINSVSLTIRKGTLEEKHDEEKPKEEERKEMIDWNKIRRYADQILSLPIELDEKTHFTEYCALGIALGVSKCQQINRDYQITENVKKGFESIVSSINTTFAHVKNTMTNQKPEEQKQEEVQLEESKEEKEEKEVKEEQNEDVPKEEN